MIRLHQAFCDYCSTIEGESELSRNKPRLHTIIFVPSIFVPSHFQCIKAIWQVLTEQATETLVLGIVISHLDYCNAILCDLPNIDISRFQVIQNMCAKLVKGTTKYASNDEALYQLHWLPVWQRIKFKILTLVNKCLNCEAPTYLENLLTHHPCTRQGLQSQWMVKRLVVPRVHRPCGTPLVEPTTELYQVHWITRTV